MRGPGKKPKKMRQCERCGASFNIAPWQERLGRKFCSQECNHATPRGKDPRIGFYENSIPEPNSGCWLWLGSIMGTGYGTVSFKGRNILAHRVSFEIENGPIPDGINICHHCDNTYCVNPAHLFPGTQLDNMRDCARKGRIVVPMLCGESSAMSKLTASEVLAIRADARMKRDIAAAYNISRTMVWQIQTRKSWSHLP